MNIVFLMDPLHTVVMEKDTSFILMIGAHRRGHNVYFLPDGGITFKDGSYKFHATKVTPQQVSDAPFIDHESQILSEKDVDILFIRNDPPFDDQYIMNTWLLDQLQDRVAIVNRPSGIRSANEKIWATQFQSIIPPTMISQNRDDLLEFLAHEKEIVAKPTDGFGGQSIFRIKENDTNAKVTLETLSDNWQKEIVLQKYVPESNEGDKRILLLNGEPLGAVLRVHAQGDHRNNFFSGGKPVASDITERDQEIINTIAEPLRQLGLYFVGIDIIGDYLIEVNVTSPTCLQEMNQLYAQQLEDTVIEFAEKLVDQTKLQDTI